VAVLGDEALCVTELKPHNDFYDFEAKYTDGVTQHICPAEGAGADRPGHARHGADCPPRAWLQGGEPFGLRWDDEQGEAGIYLLETNTQPGMTPPQPRSRAGA
jgi:D-alanine-D-alanine ligase